MKLTPKLWKLRLLLAIGALAIAFLVWSVGIEPNQLVVRHEEITLAKEAGFPPALRVAMISDLHAGSLHINLEKVNVVVDKILAEKPDVVVMLGDFFGGLRRKEFAISPEAVAGVLGRLRAPLGVYAVIGNTDYYFGAEHIKTALRAAGITVLQGDAVAITQQQTTIWIVGVDDLWAGRARPREAIALAKSGQPLILLSHHPDVFDRIPSSVHVMLAGHTHGGQVDLPVFGRLVRSHSDHGNRYAYGHVVEGGKHLWVTSGIGTSVAPVRFRVPPEIVILTLRGS